MFNVSSLIFRLLLYFVVITYLLVLYLLFPGISDYMKTFFSVSNLRSQELSLLAFILVSSLVVFTVIFSITVYNLFLYYLSKKIKVTYDLFLPIGFKSIKLNYLLLSIATIFFFCFGFFSFEYIEDKKHNYTNLLNDSKRVYDLIKTNESSSHILLYAEHVPYLYKDIGTFNHRVYPLNYFEKGSSESVIFTDPDTDYIYLSSCGYHFIKITDRLAIYSNSLSVNELLKSNGFSVCKSTVFSRQVDLHDLANINGIFYDDGGGNLSHKSFVNH